MSLFKVSITFKYSARIYSVAVFWPVIA